MPQVVQFQTAGGPRVLRSADVTVADPGAREVLVDVAAIGVNFIDVNQRSGLYPVALPFVPGVEGSGTVLAVGEKVTEFIAGDRVAWHFSPGSYAERRLLAAEEITRIPPAISFEQAAAVMAQGITAHLLVNSTYPVQAGDVVLIHGAAGGVGHQLVQLAKARGATVIGTVSSAAKEVIAREVGADHVIRYDQKDFVAEVAIITEGEGAAVVYDGVGRQTFIGSVASLRTRGTLALYGNTSGPIPLVDTQLLFEKSLFLTRPRVPNYTRTLDERQWRLGEILDAVEKGTLKIHIGGRFALSEAASAHEVVEGRQAAGKLLLIP